jgi:RHS repeat-associated protein
VAGGSDYWQFVWAFGYRGYQYDKETGLYYCQSRYYNSNLGRWLSADDVAIAQLSIGEVLGANLYAYCSNNPVNDSDPQGDFPGANILIGAIIGAVLGVVGYLVGIIFSNILSNKSPFYNFTSQINAKDLIIAVLFGALDGAIAATSISAIWGRIAGAVSSGIQSALSGGGAVEIVLSVIIGAVFSGAGAGNKVLKKFNFNRTSSALKKLDSKGISYVTKEISSAFKYAVKSNKKLYKLVGGKILSSTPKQLLSTFGLAGTQSAMSAIKKKIAFWFNR